MPSLQELLACRTKLLLDRVVGKAGEDRVAGAVRFDVDPRIREPRQIAPVEQLATAVGEPGGLAAQGVEQADARGLG